MFILGQNNLRLIFVASQALQTADFAIASQRISNTLHGLMVHCKWRADENPKYVNVCFPFIYSQKLFPK